MPRQEGFLYRKLMFSASLFLLLTLSVSAQAALSLYTEAFPGSGDVNLVGWEGVYDAGGSAGGVVGGFAWVWHSSDCENLIYTNEYTVDTSIHPDVEFQVELRRHSFYGSTPQVSVAVEVGGKWYVSKTIFVETTTVFQTQNLAYNSAKNNWDRLTLATAGRGNTATSDLSGNLTGFGLYSNSQNVGSDCTAEYDNFTIMAVDVNSQERFSDFNTDGAVDFLDYSEIAGAWLSESPEPDFNEIYDLDDDNDIDTNDLALFTEDWLLGVKYPYLPAPTNREKINFNAGWKFYRGSVPGDTARNTGFNDSSWQQVIMPHNPPKNPPDPDPLRPCWNDPGGYHYEGISWYRKHFTLDNSYQGKKVSIEFEAINTVADVWVNGTHLTTHYGGYLPFTVDVTDHANFGATENVIAVKADNTDNPDVPIGNAGWFNWGGIYRDVRLHITDKLHVTDAVDANIVAGGGVFVTYPSVSTSQAQVQVKTHVKNEHASTKNCTVSNYIVDANDMVVGQMSDTNDIAAGFDFTFTQSTKVYQPSLWHPNHPHLYTVYSEVYDGNTCVDSYETRVGIRSIDFTQAEGFKINGKRLMFIGANRMQDYPYLGYAVGNYGQRRDALKLKGGGFQFIRTSQYPQDPAFLDACDELGLTVLAPIPGFQYIGGEAFKNHSYQDMRDLIRRDRNRPCVIAWELSLNETWWTDANYTPMAMSIGHAEYPGDQCFVAGWKDIGVWGGPALYDIALRNADHDPNAWYYTGPLPLIINEYGHWRYRNNPPGQTSDVHTIDAEKAMHGPASNHQHSLHNNRGVSFLSGDALWCGIDLACYASGVLDSFRLPKFSYYFYQSQRDPNLIMPGIDSGPMVFIANYWTAASPNDVKVYSNCEQVKLYINDVLQDSRSPDTGTNTANLLHPPFTFTGLTWEAGELKAEGYIDGQLAATHIVNTPSAANSLEISFDTSVGNPTANGEDIIFVFVSVVDSNGIVVPDTSNEVTLGLSGPAAFAGPNQFEAEAGIASFLVKTTTIAGEITVTATATALTGDTAYITSE